MISLLRTDDPVLYELLEKDFKELNMDIPVAYAHKNRKLMEKRNLAKF